MAVCSNVVNVPSLLICRKFALSIEFRAATDQNPFFLSETGAALSASLAAAKITPMRRSTKTLEADECGAVVDLTVP